MEVLDACPMTRRATLPPRGGTLHGAPRDSRSRRPGRDRKRARRGLHPDDNDRGSDDSGDEAHAGASRVGDRQEGEDAATKARRVQSAFPHLSLPLEVLVDCAGGTTPRRPPVLHQHPRTPPRPSLVSCRLGVAVASSLGGVATCVPVVGYVAGPGGHLLRLQQVADGRVRHRGRAKWCGDVPLPSRILGLYVGQYSSGEVPGGAASQGRARKAGNGESSC